MKSFYKTFLLLFLNASFLTFNSFSQQAPGIEWQNTIGGGSLDILYSLQQTSDKGYILGGESTSNISGDKTENCIGTGGWEDYWIVKTDSAGNIQWQNTIGGNNQDVLHSVEQTEDGGYILGGSSHSNISGDKTEISNGGFDYWIIKTDGFGNIQWQNTIGGNATDALYSVQQTTDGGYILGGYSSSNISGDKTENKIGITDYWIVKTDSVGVIQWQNTIGGTSDDQLQCIKQTFDGGYILGGVSNSDISGDKTENSNGGWDYWIVKTDSLGNIQWQNTIGGSNDDWLYSLQQTFDGGYILGGHSESNISGDKTENCIGGVDYWIVKTDSSGIIQWQNTLGGSSYDYFYSIRQTLDGGYILGGSSTSNISGDKTENCIGGYDYWILKTDDSGNIQWQKTIGGNDQDVFYAIQQTANGGYILGGESNSNISGNKTENSNGTADYWIIKLLPDTTTSITQLPQLPNYPITISPNPSSGIFQINFSKVQNFGKVSLQVINTLGQTVFQSELQTPNFKLQTNLDLSFLPKGIYVLKINDGKNSFSKKLIIQ